MLKIMNNSQASTLIFLYLVFLSQLVAEPLVKISQGLLQGTTFVTRNGKNITAFLGVPFAEPPVGELRFRSPVPEKPWNGVRLANKDANVCPQESNGKIKGDENCLYLNVYTPLREFNISVVNSDSDRSLLPVMVWIHGGGFYEGSSRTTSYHPSYILDKDILLVVLNYRLGIFGFLSTGDSVAPGNFGLKDQVLALKWVQKNIKFFGGNPNRVTIMGESAGGASVHFHVLSNASNGLFQQYVIQSGSALAPWAYRKRTPFTPFLNNVAEKVGCPISSSEDFINCLRKTSADKLMNVLEFSKDNFPILDWAPTDELESDEAFLTDSPKNLIAQNRMKDHPFISGTVADEGLLVTFRHYINKTSCPINHLVERVINNTSNHYGKSDDTPKFIKKVQEQYFNESIDSLPKEKILHNYTTFVGDSGFYYPQLILIEKMEKFSKSPFYFYSFGYLSLNMSKIFSKFDIKDPLGVAHAEDLSYLFPKENLKEISKNDEKILKLMIDLWTSFAINGKPTSDQLDDPNLWLPYAKNRSFLQIGNMLNNTDPAVTLEQNYFTPRMEFWKKQFPVL
ncbi:esterase E4-like [Belonocnema kinseyi]|uniref:esterase E4-like n=1 Tax=Belonocnema kinseyi TaxID=2817044 RepID=UPI00143D9C4A|nr:esterase E4-like [Belonocnema kinseyi]